MIGKSQRFDHRLFHLERPVFRLKPGARGHIISDRLDGFGVSRVMFRNMRSKLGGFPKREPRIALTTDMA